VGKAFASGSLFGHHGPSLEERPKSGGETRDVFAAQNTMRSEVIVAGGLGLAYM